MLSEAELERRSDWRRGGPLAQRLVLCALLILPLNLGGCTAFLFGDDELEPQRITTTLPEGESYPSLGSVPDEPPLPSTTARRQALAEDLAADRTNARYTDESLVAEGATSGTVEPPLEPSSSVSPELPAGSAPPPPDFGEATSESAAVVPPPDLPAEDEPASAAPEPMAAASEPSTEATEQPVLAPPPAPPAPRTAEAVPSPAPPSSPLPPTALLQQQAYQQQAMETQRLQQLAAQQQAFDEAARRQAIEQQMLRQQILQQQQWQRQTLQFQARQQLAGLPPLPSPAITPAAPRAAAPEAPPPQAAAPGLSPPAAAVPQISPSLFPAPQVAALPEAQTLPSATGALPSSVTSGPLTLGGQLVGLIYFGHGSTGLDDNDQQVLRSLAALQRQSGGRPMTVVGHASARTSIVDPVKHRVANLRVSTQRAESVADALVRLGVDRSLLRTVARSDSDPVYHEFMPTGEAGNRRVEVFLQ